MSPTIPIEAKSFEFVPEPLKGIEGAPKFKLRYGTQRDKGAYRAEIAGRALVFYSNEDIRAAMIAEMRRLSGSSADHTEKMIDLAERYWAADSALSAEFDLWSKDCLAIRQDDPAAELPPEPVLDFDPEEQALIVGVMQAVQAQSLVLRNMHKANSRRNRIVSEACLQILLVSAEGFQLQRDAEGMIEEDNLAALAEWLAERSEELGVDEMSSGDAFSDLLTMARMAFHLPRQLEKNFASLLLATSALSGSQAAAEESPSPSKGSAKSKETPSTIPDTTSSDTSSSLPCPAEPDSADSTGPMAAA